MIVGTVSSVYMEAALGLILKIGTLDLDEQLNHRLSTLGEANLTVSDILALGAATLQVVRRSKLDAILLVDAEDPDRLGVGIRNN